MRYDLVEVFKFLPNDNILASNLKRGDITFIHQRWTLVVKTKVHKPDHNNGFSFEIYGLGNGTSYLPPDFVVKIVSREYVDDAGLLRFIEGYEEEQKEFERLRKEEEREELEREREYLRSRLRDLEDE